METTDRRPLPEAGSGQPDLALKHAIEAAFVGTDAARPHLPDDRAQLSPGTEDPQVGHGVLLLKAAGVASAELVAHRDTWEWLAALAVDHCHFRTPPLVEDFGKGRVRTILSGRSLIALLIALWDTRSRATPLGVDWAMSVTSYNRVASRLADITGQGETLRIVLDDGLAQDSDDTDD